MATTSRIYEVTYIGRPSAYDSNREYDALISAPSAAEAARRCRPAIKRRYKSRRIERVIRVVEKGALEN